MAIDRPSFDESWHRVASLRPRLRSVVQVHRQAYRGTLWHVYRDPGNNRFYRVPAPTHGFIGLLDGRRTVAQAWEQCQERFGDDAPTQGEAIRALGSLYRSNLLHGETPPDAAGVFERQTERRQREVKGYLQNLLFARIPLLDPEPALRKLTPLFGWVFSRVGLLLWTGLVIAGLAAVAGHADRLFSAGASVLAPGNLVWLYLCFAGLKLLHELGHGVACKRMARRERGGGEVRTLGVMLLVLMPLPYVDATSSWSFRSRWRRLVVAAAGMYVEIAAAAVAALVWSRTGEGSLAHGLAYNVMFVAGVTTILFNANPLIRFDGYYILSDLLEMPNLYQRSQNYLKYLVKRYVYGVRRPQNPAQLRTERATFVTYGVSSLVYRVLLFASIFLFVFDKLFFLGAALAIWGIVGYVVTPLVKLVHYLGTSAELMRVRPRAALATAGFTAAVVVAVGVIPWSDHGRAMGVVEPRRYRSVSLGESGFVEAASPAWRRIEPGGDHATRPVIVASNPDLETERDRLAARVDELRLSHQQARAEDPGHARIQAARLAAARQRLARIESRLAGLTVTPGVRGTWLTDDAERLVGTYQQRGEKLGVVASLDDLVVRLTVDQNLGPRLIQEVPLGSPVELRVPGRPGDTVVAELESIRPAGDDRLPSAALSHAAGGPLATRPDDAEGRTAAERFFEVRLRVRTGHDRAPSASYDHPEPLRWFRPVLFPGQRVIARFDLPDRPLLSQGYLALRQLLQQRFQI